MNLIKKTLNLIGLLDADDAEQPSYSSLSYNNTKNEEAALAHMSYLQTLETDENNRLQLIEGKTSQLVAQTGVIFSLLGLFFPLLIDKSSDLNVGFKVSLLIITLLACFFYIATISNALKNYNVRKFEYSRPSPKNVHTFQDKDLKLFYGEVIRDLLYSLEKNNILNNKKATNLIQSYRSFRVANFLTGFLIVAFCTSLAFLKPKEDITMVQDEVEVKHLKDELDIFINKLSSLPFPVQVNQVTGLDTLTDQRQNNKHK